MAFFGGMTLLLVDIFRLTAAAAGGKLGQDIPDALQADYQNTSAFQFYMEGYLQDFLAMASGGSVSFSWTEKQQTRAISYSRSMGTEVFGYGNVAVLSLTHISVLTIYPCLCYTPTHLNVYFYKKIQHILILLRF